MRSRPRRFRRAAAGLVACAVLSAGVAFAQPSPARSRHFVVDCTATRSHLAASSASREDLTFLNVGTLSVFIGGSTGDPVTLASANGWTLHVGALLSFEGRGAKAGYECLTAGGSSRINILEAY